MKARLLLFLLLAAFFCQNRPLSAQTVRIQQLEQELISASAAARVQKLIDLSEACFQAGLFEKSADWAGQAEALAKKIRLPDLRAIALNREGKAAAQLGKKGIFGKDKVAPKFLQSNEVLRNNKIANNALFLDNLENLKQLAQKAGRTADVARLETEIAAAQNGGILAPATYSASSGPNSRSELRQEVSKLEQEKAAIKQKLEQELATRAKQSSQMAEKSRQLSEKLAEQEIAISLMTEEQMKSELVLSQQKQMLDSLTFKTSLDSISLLNKELAIREANSSRNSLLYAALALLLLLGGATYSFFKARQHARQIQIEQKRSEELLLNILPALVAKELKKQGYTDPKPYEDVAVLFADFVGFSKIAEILTPRELVHELDTCFKAFDGILQKYSGLEKIKTIGDAYMCASGLSEGSDNRHIFNMVKAALEMQDWLNVWNAGRQRAGQPRFDARVGIHVGPVVAGVVGSKKFAFDIWGDTVNVAARVEQASEGGRVNLSGNAYEWVKNEFTCKYRGKIEAKNKGLIDMYFVEG